MSSCEFCAYYLYDEDFDEYVCDADVDEDDYARMLQDPRRRGCPYFRNGDEYKVVRHQI